MKKYLCVFLAVVCMFALAGCNSLNFTPENTSTEPNETTEPIAIDTTSDETCEKDDCEFEGSLPQNPGDDLITAAKPIIYLYPETPTMCSAKVTLDGELTCTYPAHGKEGWQGFVANPDGTLIFPNGKEYYALYWEGIQHASWDFSKGFCVRGEDTATFLEWALAEQGLTPREANEFIVYWLPLMQDNPYNVISFQTNAYTDGAMLEINPNPDSLLRVFMAYCPSDAEVDIQPQTFNGFVRQGFTVVEWGGSRVTKP